MAGKSEIGNEEKGGS